MSNLEGNGTNVEFPENKITKYFMLTKNENDESAQMQSKENQSDIFSKALKKQSECQNQPTDSISSKPSEAIVPTCEQLNDLVLKLEAMLSDEKKAKQKLLDDYKVLEQKYISTLQLMVKTQSLLLKHKRYMEGASSAAGNEAVSIRQEHDSSNQQKSSDSEEMLFVNVEQHLQGVNENIEVEVVSDISHEEIVKLNSIQPDKSHDSTFITNLVEILYVDKKELGCRSITGRSRTEGVKKQPITPEKIKIITSLFTKRIKNCGASNGEKVLRMAKSNINRLIGHSISNVYSKTMKSTLN